MPKLRLSDRGVIRKDWKIEVRDLTKDDLPVLHEPRARVNAAKRFRDPHHKLAKLLAWGLRIRDAAAKSGYSVTRASQLNEDPAFRELVSRYAADITDRWDENVEDFVEMATGNMIKAERQITERLEAADEEGELLPVRDLIAISRDAADRLGFGKKQTNVNVNVDFAAQLEKAIKRSGKTIAGEKVTSPPLQPRALNPPPAHRSGGQAQAVLSDHPLLSEPIRRRA